jgi:two-component system OmpR family response regulator
MDIDRQSGGGRGQGLVSEPPVARIAVVDDDERMRRLLRNAFEAGGYRVTEARNEAELMSVLKTNAVALVTLDLSLRHEDGLAIARAVRTFSDVPIVMVTARSEDIDRIIGLEIGADDYIAKPFNVREVLARVRAVLRRTSARPAYALRTENDVIRFAGFVADLAARELRTSAGRIIPTTTAEFRLLEAFATRPGRVLSRDSLIDFAGGVSAAPLERSIDTLVGRLRSKIETDRKSPQIIKTVRGAGYIFTAKPRG